MFAQHTVENKHSSLCPDITIPRGSSCSRANMVPRFLRGLILAHLNLCATTHAQLGSLEKV